VTPIRETAAFSRMTMSKVLGLTVFCSLVTGCSVDATPTTAVCPAAILDATTGDETGTPILLLVDVSGNDATLASIISKDLLAEIRPLLEAGVRPTLLLDFGGSQAVHTDECLDGSRSLKADKNNDVVQKRLIREITAQLEAVMTSAVQTGEVEITGGPSRLLLTAKQLRPHLGDELRLVLWSDLGANDGSCFDAGSALASKGTAQAVATRCEAEGLFDLSDVTIQLFGAGTTNRTAEFKLYTTELALAICGEWGSCL